MERYASSTFPKPTGPTKVASRVYLFHKYEWISSRNKGLLRSHEVLLTRFCIDCCSQFLPAGRYVTWNLPGLPAGPCRLSKQVLHG